MQNSFTHMRLNLWTVVIVVVKFLWIFYYDIWLLHLLYSITIECYVLYWICMHYTVLLNLCHDLALVLEQFGMMCCLFENWCCFNLMDWNVNGNWIWKYDFTTVWPLVESWTGLEIMNLFIFWFLRCMVWKPDSLSLCVLIEKLAENCEKREGGAVMLNC